MVSSGTGSATTSHSRPGSPSAARCFRVDGVDNACIRVLRALRPQRRFAVDKLYVTQAIQDRWKNRLSVRLKNDLTKVHPSLAPGAEGIVVEFFGPQGDHIWQVDFPRYGTINVPWQGVEILDQHFQHELDEEENARISRLLKTASEAVVYVGKDGEYKALHVWNRKGESEPAVNRNEAGKLIRLLKQLKIPVSQERWR
jgi:hypothetical protein